MAGQDVRFEGIGQRMRWDAVQGIGKGMLGMPEIMRQLKVEPEVGGHAAEPGQSGRHLWRNCGLASQHAMERLAGDCQLLSRLGHRQPKFGQNPVAQHSTRMRWRIIGQWGFSRHRARPEGTTFQM